MLIPCSHRERTFRFNSGKIYFLAVVCIVSSLVPMTYSNFLILCSKFTMEPNS